MVIAIIGVLMGLTLAGVQRVRSAASATQCRNHLRQIGLALANYNTVHGHMPTGITLAPEPGAFQYMSWHVRVLPYVEQDAIWRQSVEAAKAKPGDFTASPPHPFTTVVPLYGCPDDARVRQISLARNKLPVALTSYLGVSGVRHARQDGILFRDSKVKFTSITDGTSNTLLVGERPPSSDMWIGWWYAGVGVDFVGTADMILGTRERATTAAPDLPDCGGGSTSFRAGRLDQMCDIMHFWSTHPGGAHFAFADGSVRFLRYSADPILPALATRAGGETVTIPD